MDLSQIFEYIVIPGYKLEIQFLMLTNLSLEVLWSVGILYILCHLNATENKAWNGSFKLG